MHVIRILRHKQGLRQEDLARELGVRQSTVSMWETGEATPRIDMLIRLSRIFKCRIDDLLDNRTRKSLL